MAMTSPNKKLQFNFAVFLIAGFLFLSCDKEDPPSPEPENITTEMANGFPSNPSSLHGYFYASYRGNSSSQNGYYYGRASFGDPARDLLSNFDHVVETDVFNSNNDDRPNVQVNAVHFNNTPLFTNNPGFSPYLLQNFGQQQQFVPQATWKIEGNKSFVAFEKTVPRGFPLFANGAVATYSAYLSKGGFELDTHNFASNYDSLRVSIGFSSSAFKKAVGPGQNIVLTLYDLQRLSNYSQMEIKLYNYSNMTLKNKVYLFELSQSYNATLVIYP